MAETETSVCEREREKGQRMKFFAEVLTKQKNCQSG